MIPVRQGIKKEVTITSDVTHVTEPVSGMVLLGRSLYIAYAIAKLMIKLTIPDPTP